MFSRGLLTPLENLPEPLTTINTLFLSLFDTGQDVLIVFQAQCDINLLIGLAIIPLVCFVLGLRVRSPCYRYHLPR